MPLQLTKGKLCEIFGLRSPKGKKYYRKLREHIFTDEVLEELRLTVEDYKRRQFTYAQTQRIIQKFDIQAHEIEDETL